MRLLALFVLMMLACPIARAGDADSGAEARAVFAVRCVQCHGADLTKPKGKFGYVLDLKRVAANPKLVVPFDPAGSKLWEDVEQNEMPPDGARAGPLSDVEKQAVRAWIEAGAPRPLIATTEPVSTLGPAQAGDQSHWTRPARFLGKLHVPMVHFPIALLAAAAAGDFWFAWRKHTGIHPAVRFSIFLGAAGAVVGAGLGWIHAPYSGLGAANRTLLLHRWAGTLTAALAVLTFVAARRDSKSDRRGRAFVALLILTALAVSITGHLGGTLVYGDDYYQF